MKIGFYGNANNYPFMLARALRAMGHEVTFIVTEKIPLDRPEYRYEDVAYPYPSWIHEISPRWKTIYPTPWRRKCLELLRQCDAVILNQMGPTLLPDIGRPAIVLLTGSDLDYLDLRRKLRMAPLRYQGARYLRVLLKELLFPGILRRHRQGIKDAVLISYFYRGLVPEGDRLLDELGIEGSRRTFLQMTEPDLIPYCEPPKNSVVRTFCATRLSSLKYPMPLGATEFDYKGSDIMIRGLGLYFRTTGKRLNIRLVMKGYRLDETMELIAGEGIADQVTWLDEMSQHDVLREFREADIVFEQFGQSCVGMAGWDAMATGRPLIANGRPDILNREVSVPTPICQATTPDDVCAQLIRLVENPRERENVGLQSRDYVNKYYSAQRRAEQCQEKLREFVDE